MRHLHLVIHGRVQGVGFRHFVSRRARERGVTGEVRNLPDGSVEVHAEGDDPVLRDFLEHVRHGPPGSAVREVEQDWSEGTGRWRSFAIGG